MAREYLSDEQVEIEIDRLTHSDYVKLAKKEQQIKNRRRQYMYTLRQYEKRGKKLAQNGITIDNIESDLFDEDMGV